MNKFNYSLLANDIEKKIQKENIRLKDMEKTCGVGRNTFYRIKKKEGMTMHSFLCLVNWLGVNANRYFL